MDTLITTLISLFSAAASFIPATATSRKTLFDYRSSFFKAIKLRGWLTIICLAISIGLTIYQANRNKEQSDRKELESKKELERRENILRAKYDSSTIVTIKTITEAFGRYGLKLDTTKNKIVEVIKDSSGRKVIVGPDPILVLCPDSGLILRKIVNSRYFFNILFCSDKAGATNFDINTFIVYGDSLNLLHFIDTTGFPLMPSRAHKISENRYTHTFFQFTTYLKVEYVYVYLKGTYTNIDNSKKYPIDEIYYYKISDKSFGMIGGTLRNDIISAIKSKQQ